MSLHGGIYARLVAQVSGVSGRVYRRPMPQTVTLPACEYFVVSNLRRQSLEGTETPAVARVQVNSWADTHSAAQAVADQVRGALDGWKGTSDSTTFDWCRIENELDDYEPDTEEHAVVQDFFVSYRE